MLSLSPLALANKSIAPRNQRPSGAATPGFSASRPLTRSRQCQPINRPRLWCQPRIGRGRPSRPPLSTTTPRFSSSHRLRHNRFSGGCWAGRRGFFNRSRLPIRNCRPIRRRRGPGARTVNRLLALRYRQPQPLIDSIARSWHQLTPAPNTKPPTVMHRLPKLLQFVSGVRLRQNQSHIFLTQR